MKKQTTVSRVRFALFIFIFVMGAFVALAESTSDTPVDAFESTNDAVAPPVSIPDQPQLNTLPSIEEQPHDAVITVVPSPPVAPSADSDAAAALVEIKVNTLPKVTPMILPKPFENSVVLPLPEQKTSEGPSDKPHAPSHASPVNIDPEGIVCHSGRTDYILADSFDCSEGVREPDQKATPLYTNRGKKYAYLEVAFPHEALFTSLKLKILHAAEFPTQQRFSVFYQEDNIWKGACHNLQTSRDGGVSECDVSAPAMKHNDLRVRIEAYSREGPAVWNVNNVKLVTETIAQRATPVENLARAIPQPTGEIWINNLPPNTPPVPPQPPAPPTDPELTTTTNFITSGGLRASGEYLPPTRETTATPEPTPRDEIQELPGEQPQAPFTPDVVMTPDEGFFSLTGAAIANLATKNPFGAFLTLVIVGVAGYIGYTFITGRKR